MNPVNWFEIPVSDMQRAKKFFEASFGLTINLMDMPPMEMAFFPMEDNAYGATGALVKGESYVPSHDGTVIYFSVEDIQTVLNKITAAGGKVLFPRTAIGEYGFIAHFEDTEGNRLALHSMKG